MLNFSVPVRLPPDLQLPHIRERVHVALRIMGIYDLNGSSIRPWENAQRGS